MNDDHMRACIIRLINDHPGRTGHSIGYEMGWKYRLNIFRTATLLKEMADEGVLRREDAPDEIPPTFRYWVNHG